MNACTTQAAFATSNRILTDRNEKPPAIEKKPLVRPAGAKEALNTANTLLQRLLGLERGISTVSLVMALCSPIATLPAHLEQTGRIQPSGESYSVVYEAAAPVAAYI